MADYFPVLSRAVAGLESNTADARRAVYERARAAITRQLRAIEPPLAEEDIAREQSQLEEAIRKIEASAASPAAAAPRTPTPPPAANAPSRAPEPRPSPREAAPERPAPRERPQQERPAGERPAQARPAARADGRPIIQSGGPQRGQTETKRSGPMIAIALLAVVAIGAGLFAARGPISAMLGGGSKTAEQQPSGTPAAGPSSSEEKAADRVTQDGADRPAQPEQKAAEQPAPQQPPQEVARAPEPTAPQPAVPAEPAQPAAPSQSQQEPPAQPGPLVTQRAVLYEEGPNQQSGEASQGTVTWRTESVSGGPDQPLETALRGDIEIPGRKLRATLTLRRNGDATLPASHTIEIQFSLPEDFPNAGISNVPGVLMKADEAARGAAVSGLSVRVTSGFFLIGLSNLETERSVNEQLLRDRGWIDIPILYDNGRRAVLTLEKGTPGTQAFQDAFSAWRSASSAPGGTPPAAAANP